MYQTEKKQLRKRIEPIYEILKASKAIIAGGAITSLFCNREINDIDIYFPSEESLFRTVAGIYNDEDFAEIVVDKSFDFIVHATTQRSIMGSVKVKGIAERQLIQLMSFRYFKDADDIFNSFDFTCCMGAYDVANDEIILHPEFLKHNSQRYLKFNPNTDFPIMSATRVQKYQEKGYTISKAEYLRVLFTCMKSSITSWDEAKEHIGGMYGYDMDKAFDTDKEFSVEELIAQLSNLHERGEDLYTPIEHRSVGFTDVCQKFFAGGEFDVPKKYNFQPEKYYYKCVNKDWKSPVFGGDNVIEYTEGSLIDMKKHPNGIYIHKDHTRPHHDSIYWVELEIVEGCRADTHGWSRSEAIIRPNVDVSVSTVRVNKCFTYHYPMYSWASHPELWEKMEAKFGFGGNKEPDEGIPF